MFTENNIADNPDREIIPKNYFTLYTKFSAIFKTLNNKRSFGIDNIPNVALKQISANMIRYYSILFNDILNNMYSPDSWKLSKVIALKKKGNDISNPSNFRPISLLWNISKIFEFVLDQNLTIFCVNNDIIPEAQFGFK